MKEMSTIKFPNGTEAFEIVDNVARTNLNNKSDVGHTHNRTDIVDFPHEHDERYYTENEIDTKLLELNNTIVADYESKTEANNKLTEAKEYADTAITNLVNSAPETLDTLGELATAFNENKEVVDALNEAITNKQNKLSGAEGQVVGFDVDGNAIAQDNPQTNWAQNNTTALDYVKNRTHWVKTAETLLDNEVFECTTLASDSESYYATKSGNIGLISGNKYNVTVNGTAYTSIPALIAFGTNDISLMPDIETCRIYDRENGTVEVFSDTSITLTISIEDAEDIYIPLDEKFIPDVFARSTDVDLKMDKENPAGTGSFSMNRAVGSAIGENSIAIGTDCIASGESAVAIGSGASAIGFASHAEGSGTVAQGELAHAEGQDAVANGYASHAESSGEANGDYSHAEGYGIADGDYSHASGNGTWAVGRSQTVIGEANYEDEAEDATARGTYAFIVGNGDLEAGEYSNAHTLDWQGNAWFQGDVYVGSTSGTNKDEGSVKLQKEITGTPGQFVVIGDDGNVTTKNIKEMVFTVSIPLNWEIDTVNGGYFQTVYVDGILEEDNPTVDIVLGYDVNTNTSQLQSYGCITKIITVKNYITLYADNNIPTSEFTIKMKVVR